MDLKTPPELQANQAAMLEMQHAQLAMMADGIRQLVQLPAYRYLKAVSMAYVIQPYECSPPMTETDRTKWETYNTVRWSFERFFALLEQTAKTAGELPKGQIDADNRGQSVNLI